MCQGKFVGAVDISAAMNLEDLWISQDLEISQVPPHQNEADQWQIEQRRKLSEITFDPRQTGPPTPHQKLQTVQTGRK